MMMTSVKMPPNTGLIMITIFVDFVLDIDEGPCKNGFPGRYVKFQLEFLESKVGGIGPLKLLFQANNSDKNSKSAIQFGIIPDSKLFCKNLVIYQNKIAP
jgi:hypothetical protein